MPACRPRSTGIACVSTEREALRLQDIIDNIDRIGRHVAGMDFAAFAANRGKPDKDTVRTVHSIRISRRGPLVALRFEGNGFLYRMVRLLTGSLVRVAQGKESLDWLRALLAGKGAKKSHFTAPADGLYLVRVLY